MAHDNEHENSHDPNAAEPSIIREIFSVKNVIFTLIVLALAALAFFFLRQKHDRPLISKEGGDGVVISVPVVPVIKKVLFREDQLPGEIDAYQDVLIYPKVPGFIKEIKVDRGSIVKKGDLLVRMYAPEYLARRHEATANVAAANAALAAEESKLEDLKAELDKRRAKLLADQSTYQRVYAASLVPGVIADNDVVQWSQTVEASRQEVNSFIKRVNAKDHEVAMRRQELSAVSKSFENFADFASYLEIYAPFDGYVTERKMHVGSFVGPDGTGAYPPICRLKQLDLLRVIAPVPEPLAQGVIMGSEVEFTVSSFPGERFKGTVARISNSLDKETRTMPVELNYLDTSLFVPISAVVSTPLTTFVCKVRDDRVEWVNVKKGEIMDGMVEVFGDLAEGDQVARQGSEELENQSRVKPVGKPVKVGLTGSTR
jgi:multidrug resistance efflux pump